MKKILIFILSLFLISGCSSNEPKEEFRNTTSNDIYENYKDAHILKMENGVASLDGVKIDEFDYVWHLNQENGEEYYSGSEPQDKDVYIAHDIIYYPLIEEDSFEKENYDGEMEWVSHYKNEELSEYILATLPVLGDDLPTEMMHSEEDAYNNPVIHINKAGSYILEGNWNGQIWIDLGKDSFDDESQKVTIILNGVDVSCGVAPAIVFRNVYECDNDWENREMYSNITDLSDVGAKVIIVDGTENNFIGANIYRILKPEYKKEGSAVQKKRYKIDGAFYSFESMVIEGSQNGTGILNITSTTFEGLDTELHLTINSGYINIVSNDDGINVNEDDVSVFTMNGGRLTIFAGQGAEGDVIDSNGYIKINGGTVLGTTPSSPDEILDSACGVEVSDTAKVISSGAVKNNLGSMMGGFGPNNNFNPNDFKPEDMPDDFDPNNMPQGFNPMARPGN